MKILQIRVGTAVTIITNIVTCRQTNKKKIEKEKKRKRKRKKKKEYNFSEGNFPFSLSALIHLTVTQWFPVPITGHYTERHL